MGCGTVAIGLVDRGSSDPRKMTDQNTFDTYSLSIDVAVVVAQQCWDDR